LIWLILVAVVFVAGGTWLFAMSLPMRLAVLGLGLAGAADYWFIGQPGMSDRPLEMRLAEIEQMIRTSPERLTEKEAIAIAERRAREHPTDPTPHLMIARIYESLAQRAQAEGMRSRAAYKLEELIDRNRLLKPGMAVVDLGAAPGGWTRRCIGVSPPLIQGGSKGVARPPLGKALNHGAVDVTKLSPFTLTT
jgi:hypothetical protein